VNDILVKVHNYYALQWRGPGLVTGYRAVLGAGANRKTCDKPINFIVRVSFGNYLLIKLFGSVSPVVNDKEQDC